MRKECAFSLCFFLLAFWYPFFLAAPFFYEDVTAVDKDLCIEQGPEDLSCVVRVLYTHEAYDDAYESTGVVLAHLAIPSKRYSFVLTVLPFFLPVHSNQKNPVKHHIWITNSFAKKPVKAVGWRCLKREEGKLSKEAHNLHAMMPRGYLCVLKLPALSHIQGAPFGIEGCYTFKKPVHAFLAGYGASGIYTKNFLCQETPGDAFYKPLTLGRVTLCNPYAEETHKVLHPAIRYYQARLSGAADVLPAPGDAGSPHFIQEPYDHYKKRWRVVAVTQRVIPYVTTKGLCNTERSVHLWAAKAMYHGLPKQEKSTMLAAEKGLTTKNLAALRRALLNSDQQNKFYCADLFLITKLYGNALAKQALKNPWRLAATCDGPEACVLNNTIKAWILTAVMGLCNADKR